MAADPLNPRCARLSMTKLLSMEDTPVIGVNEEGYHRPVPSQYRKNKELCLGLGHLM